MFAHQRTFAVVLVFVLATFGWGNSAQGADLRSDGGLPKRDRDAAAVVSEFVGHYLIEDSRYNSKQVDRIDIEVVDAVPTLSAFKGDELIAKVSANDCSGDIVNKYSKNMFLVCYSWSEGTARKAWFKLSRVLVPESWSDGRVLSNEKPMNMVAGYFVEYDLGNKYQKAAAFAAKREGQLK